MSETGIGNGEAYLVADIRDITSARWRKFLPGLCGQGTSSIRPFEWFGHRPVEVVDKIQNALA